MNLGWMIMPFIYLIQNPLVIFLDLSVTYSDIL